MEEFLSHTRAGLERGLERYSKVAVVRGNESCDLDSTVSALALALYLHQTSGAGGNTLHLPLLNIPRRELRLRTDITFFLNKCGIGLDLLTFRDDLDLHGLFAEERLALTLVDHHVLSGQDARLAPSVVRILDHRPREPDMVPCADATVELVGSCSTLVTEVLLGDPAFSMDLTTATLLYGTILVDTINLSPEARKATDRDRSALAELKSRFPDLEDGDSLFSAIHTAKFDLSGLTTREILGRDVKVVTGSSQAITISSVTAHIQTLLSSPTLAEDLQEFCKEQATQAVVVMALSTDSSGTPHRQLAVFSASRIYRQQIADVLQGCSSPPLQLTPLTSSVPDLLAFQQGNTAASRKQVLPVLKGFLQGETTPDDSSLQSPDANFGFSSFSNMAAADADAQDKNNSSSAVSSPIAEDATDGGDGGTEDGGQQRVFDPFASIHTSDSQGSALSVPPLSPPATTPKPPATLPASDPFDDLLVDFGGSTTSTSASTTTTAASSGKPIPEFDLLGGQEMNFDPLVDVGDGGKEEKAGEGACTTGDLLGDFEDAAGNVDPFESQSLPGLLAGSLDSSREGAGLASWDCSPLTSGTTSGVASQGTSQPGTPPPRWLDAGLPTFSSGGQPIFGSWTPSENSIPQTPQNSFVDAGSILQQQHQQKRTELPASFGGAEDVVQRVEAKRKSLGGGEVGGGDAEGFPFTPPNSFVEGTLERMLGEARGVIDREAVVRRIQEQQQQQLNPEGVASSGGDAGGIQGTGDDKDAEAPAPSEADQEAAVAQDVAMSLASELIEHALDTFPVADLPSSDSASSLPSPDVRPPGGQTPSPHSPSPGPQGEDGARRTSEERRRIGASSSQLSSGGAIPVETEYLHDMDPLHGSFDVAGTRDASRMETDVDKEVVEGTSFRKISGEEAAASAQELLRQQGRKMAAHTEESEEAPAIAITSPGVAGRLSPPSLLAESDQLPGLAEEISAPMGQKRKVAASAESSLATDPSTNHPADAASVAPSLQTPVSELSGTAVGSEEAGEGQGSPEPEAAARPKVIHPQERASEDLSGGGRRKVIPLDLGADLELTPAPPAPDLDPSAGKVGGEVAGAGMEEARGGLPQAAGRETQQQQQQQQQQEGEAGEGRAPHEDPGRPVRPSSLQESPDGRQKLKIKPDFNFLDDDDDDDEVNDLDFPDDMDESDDDTPSLDRDGEMDEEARDAGKMVGSGEEIPEYSATEEYRDSRNWKVVQLGDKQFRIDLRVIEPYKRVLSHGGYYGDGLNAIIVFSGCYLPDRRRKDYHYVMDNLFVYVVHTLEELVADDYVIVYFHGATPRRQMPSFSWLKKCYQMINRRLRKNLKGLMLVHPTLWLKTIVNLTKPFISSKFTSKLKFVKTLRDLSHAVPMTHIYVPDQVRDYDDRLSSQSTPSTPPTPHPAPRPR